MKADHHSVTAQAVRSIPGKPHNRPERLRSVATIRLLAALAILTCGSTFASAPHPFHSSMAEMEYNPATKNLEVSLRLYIVDCETALTKLSGKPIQIGNETSRDQLLAKYLKNRFRIEPKPTAKPKLEKPKKKGIPPKSSLNYIGSEIDKAYVWVYFELTPPPESRDFTLRNDVLVEVQPEQTNVVQFRHPNGRTLHSFDAKNRIRKLSFAKSKGNQRTR